MATDGYTHSITPEMFNKADSKKSGLKWEDQPCSAGSVRIFMPHISRGNKGSSGEERIAVPTYHTAVSKDGVNLNIRECGTKDEMAAALRDQRSPNATPSGLENDKHEGLSFRHPATVGIRGISSTSDALMGLRSWDSVEVLEERDLLFSQDLPQVREMIEFCRNSSLAQVKRAHERMREAEIAAFGPMYRFLFGM